MENLSIKQVLTISAYSKFFKDTYKSEIVDIRLDGLVIKTPKHQGGLILMGVGTRLKITAHRIDQVVEFESELLERFNNDNLMLITRPDQIGRGGRTWKNGAAKVIAVTSGKGGVGKSTLTINLALALRREGYRVAMIDADLGTANLDIMLGLKVNCDLTDVVEEKKEITQILIKGPEGVILVPGGSGFQELTEMSEWQFTRLINSFNYLDDICDYILIDTGAGLSRNVTNFLLAADEVIIVTTPEPHVITDGYAIIKIISEFKKEPPHLHLIVNKAETREEGKNLSEKIKEVAKKYLDLEINYLGALYDDKLIVKSNKNRIPILIQWPDVQISQNIRQLIKVYLNKESAYEQEPAGITSFIRKMKGLFQKN